jgi:hypothetical protein
MAVVNEKEKMSIQTFFNRPQSTVFLAYMR